jgi:hypothetical protein
VSNERREVSFHLTKPSLNPREIERAHIEKAMVDFLAKKKNKIKIIAQGATGFEPQKKNSIINTLSKASKAKHGSRVWNDAGGKK